MTFYILYKSKFSFYYSIKREFFKSKAVRHNSTGRKNILLYTILYKMSFHKIKKNLELIKEVKIMKKFIIFLSLALVAFFFHFNSMAKEENIVYSIGKYENSKVTINHDDSQINLSYFPKYYISDYYDYGFYLFDVLEKNIDNIYEIKCITKNANYDYKITQTNGKDLNLYNTLEIITIPDKVLNICYIPLEKEDFNFLFKNAETINFSENSELVECLKQSLSFEFMFKSHLASQRENTTALKTQDITRDFQNSNTYCNKNNTVKYGACSEYTSTNSCIDQLKKENKCFMGQIFNRKQFTDCPLVYVIPKKYFMTRGIYSYIGPEYGFYINTYQDTGNDNMSNFIIFDIQTKKKAYNQNGEVIVKPILTGYTKYKRDSQIVTYEVDTSNLALTNINLAVNLYNQTEKNIGDEGYIPEQDYGYAFKGFGIEAKASEKEAGNSTSPNFLLAKLTAIGLKFIPKIGPYVSLGVNTAITLIENFYKEESKTQYQHLIKNDTSYYANTFSLNSSDSIYSMIKEYGNIVKGINANLQQEEDEIELDTNNPLLYKAKNDDYFKLTYTLFQHSADVCWDTTILSNLSLDIVEDNTYKFHNTFGGEIINKDTVTGSWIDSFNENPTVKETTMYLDNVYSVEYGIDNYQLLNFSPIYSGNYCFETYNTESDTIMQLLKNGTLITTNDDGGSYIDSNNAKLCSKINWNLEYGNKYTIKIYGYNGKGGYCNVRVKKMASNLKEFVEDSFICNSNNYTSESYWQEFVPNKTGYYSFSVNSSECSVELTLYDWNHNRLASDFYASYSGRVILYLYLEANQKYFVQSKIHGYMGRSYTFGVFTLSIPFILKPSEFYSEQFYLDEGYPNTLYTIVVSDTKSYSLGLHLIQGYNYLHLRLYNENFERIHAESFLGKSYMPINVTLTKNKCYYLYIQRIPNITDLNVTQTQANIFLQGV